MDDRLIKMQSIAELRETLRVKQLNENLLDLLTSSMSWLKRYCEKNGIPFPYEELGIRWEKILATINQIQGLSPENEHAPKSPEDRTKSKIFLIKRGVG